MVCSEPLVYAGIVEQVAAWEELYLEDSLGHSLLLMLRFMLVCMRVLLLLLFVVLLLMFLLHSKLQEADATLCG